MFRDLVGRTLIANIAILALGLVNSILLSRWLGPEGRGQIAAALLWPTLLIYLGSIGLFPATLYHAASPDHSVASVFATALGMAVLLSIPAMMLGFVAMPLLLNSQTLLTVAMSRLYLLVIPISMLSQCAIGVIQARLKITTFNWLRLMIPAGYLAGTVTLYLSGMLSLNSVIVLQLALNLVVLILALAAVSRLGINIRVRLNKSMASQMLRYGFRVQIGEWSQIANLRLDQVLMAGMLPAVHLGWYVTAVSAAGLAQSLSTAVKMVVIPSVANQAELAVRINLLRRAFQRYWILSLIITAGVAVLLPVLIPLIFGEEFRPSVPVAEVLLVGTLFIGAKEVLTGGAQALGNPWLGSRAELLALGVTVVLLPALLPSMGIMGAAIASAAAYFTSLIVLVYGLRQKYVISARSLFRVQAEDLKWVWSTAFALARQARQKSHL